MARRHGVTLIVTVLHCTSQQEITAGEQLLNWGFAMDGKVRAVGELVGPLPALTASRKKLSSPAARPALPRRAALSSRAALPAIPLAAGAGAIIVIVFSAGWLTRRRRRGPHRRGAAPTCLSSPVPSPATPPRPPATRSPEDGGRVCHEGPTDGTRETDGTRGAGGAGGVDGGAGTDAVAGGGHGGARDPAGPPRAPAGQPGGPRPARAAAPG